MEEKSIDRIWDEYEISQLISLFYSLRTIDISQWDETLQDISNMLISYHQQKHPACSNSELDEFSLFALGERLHGIKMLDQEIGVCGEDYSEKEAELFQLRKIKPGEFNAIIMPKNIVESGENQDFESITMENREWDEYESACFICVCKQLKDADSVSAVIRDFRDHLKQYTEKNGHPMDLSRNAGAINRRAFQMDFLLSSGKQGKKGSPKIDCEMVRLYFEKPDEFKNILEQAIILLGYSEKRSLFPFYRPKESIDYSDVSKNEYKADSVVAENAVDLKENKRYRKILEENFSNGIRIESRLDQHKFKQRYTETFHIDMDESKFKENIKSIAYEKETRWFLQESEKQLEFMQQIIAEVSAVFENGFTCVYIECIYNHFKDEIEEHLSVYSKDTFIPILMRAVKGKYDKDGWDHLFPKGEVPSPDADVKKYIRDSQRELSYIELEQDLWFIPLKKIKQVIHTTDLIINTGKNTYMSIETFPINIGDLKKVKEIINAGISTAPKAQLSAEECRRLVYIDCKTVKIDTENFSLIGFHNALGYLLRNDFSFSSTFVTEKDKRIDTTRLYKEFCEDRMKFKLDDLKEYAKEINAPISHDVVRNCSIRIDEDNFYSPELVHFDVERIDKSLEENFCLADYLPICNAEALLSLLPSVDGIKWTGYLLESFLYSYSKEFSLMHKSFSEKNFNGVMVKNDSKFESYEQVIIDVLSHRDNWENKDDALEILTSGGYLTKARCKDIEDIIKNAKMKQNKGE